MRKFRAGDVFEMPFRSKYAYLQLIATYEPIAHMIRAYTKIHDEPVADLDVIRKSRSFWAMTNLYSFLLSPPLIRRTGNLPFDTRDVEPVYFRMTKPNSAGVSQILGPDGLGVIDRVLAEDEMKWPAFPGFQTPARLMHYILKDNGIDVPVDDLFVSEVYEAEEGEGLFYLYFKRKRDAGEAARSLTLPGLRSKIIKEDESSWLLLVMGQLTQQIADIEDHLTTIAQANNGEYDGNELPVG